MKKVIFLLFLFGSFAYGQQFENIGFENTSCVNNCDQANNQMACVDGWWSDYTQGVVPLKRINCEPDNVCNGNNSVLLVSTSGAPGSAIRTNNPFFGMTLDSNPIIRLTVNKSSQGHSSGGIRVIGRHAGQNNWDVLGFGSPDNTDTCEDISIVLDETVTNFAELSFFACTATGTCHGGVGNYIVVDDIGVVGDVINVDDDCGNLNIQINPQADLDVTYFAALVTDSNGNEVVLENDSGNPLVFDLNQTGTYTIEVYILHTVNGQSEFLFYELTHTITDITPLPVTITANGTDITDTLTYTIPCGDSCVTINATNLENVVYNTSDPVLNDLNGLFCVPTGSSLTSFTANITGIDSCGNPYSENVVVNVEQDCCTDKPVIEPYWQHPDCPEVVCDAEQWPIHILSDDGTPITSAGGIMISWDNLDTPGDENILADWIFVSQSENWEATITYPDGCEYVITYVEDCCDDDVFIRVIECPSEEQLLVFQEQAHQQYLAEKDEASESLLNILTNYMQNRIPNKDCDPCDLNLVFVELVDGAGNPIDIDVYDTLSWSDGGFGTMRAFTLPMSEEVCVTATNTNEHGNICTYSDCFFYECEEKCDDLTAPTNLQANGTTLSWDPVPGATSYIISSPAWNEPQIECRCKGTVSLNINTEETSHTLSNSLASKCFVWRVTAVCEDGTQSAPSQQMCFYPIFGPELPNDDKVTLSPNPNDGMFSINMDISYDTEVSIEIRDFYGRIVTVLSDSVRGGKSSAISWDGTGALRRGIYFVEVKTDRDIFYKKMIVK